MRDMMHVSLRLISLFIIRTSKPVRLFCLTYVNRTFKLTGLVCFMGKTGRLQPARQKGLFRHFYMRKSWL